MVEWPKGLLAVCDVDTLTPVAYINVYEQNDIWIKTEGCEGCPEESRRRCCGRCAFRMEAGCAWHFETGDAMRAKPFVCVVRPFPTKRKVYCQLEYLCVQGLDKGKTLSMRQLELMEE